MAFGASGRVDVNHGSYEIKRASGAVATWCKRQETPTTREEQEGELQVLCDAAALSHHGYERIGRPAMPRYIAPWM
jgi:hypothetical protein